MADKAGVLACQLRWVAVKAKTQRVAVEIFSRHYMRAVLRYGVIIPYAHPGAVATIGTLNFDNYSSHSHSCLQGAPKLSANRTWRAWHHGQRTRAGGARKGGPSSRHRRRQPACTCQGSKCGSACTARSVQRPRPPTHRTPPGVLRYCGQYPATIFVHI